MCNRPSSLPFLWANGRVLPLSRKDTSSLLSIFYSERKMPDESCRRLSAARVKYYSTLTDNINAAAIIDTNISWALKQKKGLVERIGKELHINKVL